jgi:hypothetical protein
MQHTRRGSIPFLLGVVTVLSDFGTVWGSDLLAQRSQPTAPSTREDRSGRRETSSCRPPNPYGRVILP